MCACVRVCVCACVRVCVSCVVWSCRVCRAIGIVLLVPPPLLPADKFAADVALVNMTEWIVSAESLKIGDLVGAGAFAQVYRAHLHGQEVPRRPSPIQLLHSHTL